MNRADNTRGCSLRVKGYGRKKQRGMQEEPKHVASQATTGMLWTQCYKHTGMFVNNILPH